MKIVVATYRFPEFDASGGELRLFQIINTLKKLGHELVILAHGTNPPRYKDKLESLGIRCVCAKDSDLANSALNMRAFCEQEQFDWAIMESYGIYQIYAWYFRTFLPRCNITLDTVDLHFIRLGRECLFYTDLTGEAEQARQAELQSIKDADSVWVVSDVERKCVEAVLGDGKKPVCIVPSVHVPTIDAPGFSEREGIIFLGGYKHRPNVDAVHYFMQEIYPRLPASLRNVRITIAGSNPVEEFAQYESEHVHITGQIADPRQLLSSHRVGVAPLRYGAGLKVKVLEYLACGLPCIGTDIAFEGMPEVSNAAMNANDDANEFATQIQKLYSDSSLWQAFSKSGQEYVMSRYSIQSFENLIVKAVESVRARSERRGSTGLLVFERLWLNRSKAFALGVSAMRAVKNWWHTRVATKAQMLEPET